MQLHSQPGWRKTVERSRAVSASGVCGVKLELVRHLSDQDRRRDE